MQNIYDKIKKIDDTIGIVFNNIKQYYVKLKPIMNNMTYFLNGMAFMGIIVIIFLHYDLMNYSQIME